MKQFFLSITGAIFINTSIAQNVGIGETTPQSRLEIKGANNLASYYALMIKNSNNDSLFRITNAGEIMVGSKTKNYGQLQIINDGNDYRHLILKGTNHLNSGQFNTAIRLSDETENRYWQFRSRVYGNGSGIFNHSKYNTLILGTDSLADMITIDGSGKIAMGESTIPLAFLDIASNFQTEPVPQLMLRGTGVQSRSYQYFGDIGGSNYWYLEGRHDILDPTNTTFNLGYNGIGKITLTEAGNFGIGGYPFHRQHIRANSVHAGLVQLQLEETEEDYARLRFKNTVADRYWEIGSLPKTSNTDAVMNFYYNNSGVVLTLNGDGNATLMGTLTQLSDAREKTNISQLKNSLPLLLEINGYRYNWKNLLKDREPQIGLLAQEIENVLPELVKENPEGLKSVNYSGLIPFLIEAIKEQQQQISRLNEEIKNLNRLYEIIKKKTE
ncbi:MAG TPA: tail fiber domain-containing protein [Ferruginibacter sp.]|nr:tail fiber domain-containing protein [Ferruginibacter sp.]